MVIYDPIYGSFSVPEYLDSLLLAPAVRRLGGVRLLNTPSPSIAALGEIRRYSHTLGVLFLCQQNQLPAFSIEERKALAASVILHDIGTPPFAHLLEYHLNEREPGGWNHERMIDAVLNSTHVPENRAHQIFAGRANDLTGRLCKCGISLDLVRDIVTGKHPLSALLFGTLDFDNLDNVLRMAWGLGLSPSSQSVVHLAAHLSVNEGQALMLSESESAASLREWLRLRRGVYEILLFNAQAMAAQAVLFLAIGIALNNDVISRDEWTDTDEQLIDILLRNKHTKDMMSREFFDRLPSTIFILQVEGTLENLGLSTRTEAMRLAEQVLAAEFPKQHALSYVVIDRGTFEKKVVFIDGADKHGWSLGENTQSVIFYGFLRRSDRASTAKCRAAVSSLLDALGAKTSQIVYSQLGDERRQHDQRTLDFATA